MSKVLLLAAMLACGVACSGSASPPSNNARITVTVQVNTSVPGRALNSTFAGFSYEKSQVSKPFFSAGNTALVKLFQRLGPSILRVGGNSVDKTTWNPSGAGLTSGTVAPADIDRLASFLRAADWQVIYGMNLASNTPGQMASEAAYAAQSLGDRLYGYEIGNEPDLYHSNGDRPSTYTFSDFLSEWQSYAGAVRAQVPDAAFTGPAAASNTNGYTIPFAKAEASVLKLLTQHYYRANGQSPTSTLTLLLSPDPNLPGTLQALSSAAQQYHVAEGFRLAEANSFYNGGAPGVSDAYGTALWAIDFLFINALNGSTGVNFHGGGNGPGYTPIADDGTSVVEVRPEFYGIYLFSMAANGNLLGTTVDASGLSFSTYAVQSSGGQLALLFVNKDATHTAQVTTVDLNMTATAATLTVLTGPTLESTSGEELNGAAIGSDGSWAPQSSATQPVSNGVLRISVSPASAVLALIH